MKWILKRTVLMIRKIDFRGNCYKLWHRNISGKCQPNKLFGTDQFLFMNLWAKRLKRTNDFEIICNFQSILFISLITSLVLQYRVALTLFWRTEKGKEVGQTEILWVFILSPVQVFESWASLPLSFLQLTMKLGIIKLN